MTAEDLLRIPLPPTAISTLLLLLFFVAPGKVTSVNVRYGGLDTGA